ncbi:MAG: efflux transporter outer membrane subunit [Sphingomonas sp.]|jgi:NodT family efflux transporter outer membrane factor (OMF) lipoprotein
MRILIAIAPALALAACAVAPEYRPAPLPVAATGPFLTRTDAVVTAPADPRWWRLYNDPALNALVAQALAANADIRVAVARLERARASLNAVRSDRLPQATLGAGVNYGQSSAVVQVPGTNRQDLRTDTGLDVAYEVDLFARVKRGVEAAHEDVAAAQADVDAVRVSVAAETTRAYAAAASTAERLAVAEHIVTLLDRSALLTGKRADAGLTTSLDTARITALRDQRRAEIPTLQAERQAALFRLATLAGRAPADLPVIGAARATTLRLDQPIPVGDGAQLLARRPDVAAAERRLVAATARIGVATAELYPHISLGASVGSTSIGAGDLFSAGSLRWLLGPLISWSFPNQARARAQIAGAQADTRAALAAFDGAVLTALGETETALSNYSRLLERRIALKSARDQADKAVQITRAQQREGLINSLDALDAERTFAEVEAQVALADARIADAQVDVFKALGGRWQATD